MRRARFLLAILLPLGLEACVLKRTVSAYDVGPTGLTRRDERLRTAFVSGRVDSAFRLSRKELPEDALLRSLYEGTVAYYGGRHEEGARALRQAAALAEDRYTKSASRALAATVTNDLALQYEPGHTERLFIHYYAALTHLARNDATGAAVEARRLAFLLERWDEAIRPGDRDARALLRYFTGAVFEAAGEWNDAAVAYRNARLLAQGTSFGDTTSLGLPVRPGADSGEVVLFVEHGFVAHRVNQLLSFGLTHGEYEALKDRDVARKVGAAGGVGARVLLGLASGDDEGVWWNGRQVVHVHTDGRDPHDGRERRSAVVASADATATAAPRAAAAPVAPPIALAARPDGDGKAPRDSARGEGGPGEGGKPEGKTLARGGDSTIAIDVATATKPARKPDGFWRQALDVTARDREDEQRPWREPDPGRITRTMSIAWPVYRRSALEGRPIVRLAADTLRAPVAPVFRADVSEGVVEDYRRVRAGIVARAVLRLVAKEIAEDAAEGAASEKWGKKKGWVVGFLVGAFGDAMERADTRSWQLLPAGTQVLRLRLPEGRRVIVVEGADGERREVAVQVRAGGTTVLATRMFGRTF